MPHGLLIAKMSAYGLMMHVNLWVAIYVTDTKG